MLSTFVTTIIVNCVCPDWRCWSPTVHHSICAWNSVAWTMFYWVAFTTAAVTLVVVVVVVFIAASAQPANSTRVITCCSSSQSCRDHKITLTSLPACVAAACTYAFHRNSVALANAVTISSIQMHQDDVFGEVQSGLCSPLAAFSIILARDVLTSATIGRAHWSATQPEQLALYSTWDRAAIVGVTLARGTLTAAIIHTKWDPTGHTKSASKQLIHRDSQQGPKQIAALFRFTRTSSSWREKQLLSSPGKDNMEW